uniref:Uncharacterized protein n=1 Tax=Anguilla anguilla TaxID=7936 RepID=A0A0E9W2F2_ANGAN
MTGKPQRVRDRDGRERFPPHNKELQSAVNH